MLDSLCVARLVHIGGVITFQVQASLGAAVRGARSGFPSRFAAILREMGPSRVGQFPGLRLFFSEDFAGAQAVRLGPVLQAHIGVGDQIVVPGGVARRAGGGGDGHVGAVTLDPHEWAFADVAVVAPVVVRMTTGRPSSVPPSRPSVAS
jgi:hypothetical protein